MYAAKVQIQTSMAIPLIAALPYRIAVGDGLSAGEFSYNPGSQLTQFAGRRDYSTCREDESAGGFFSSKSDTKKDD